MVDTRFSASHRNGARWIRVSQHYKLAEVSLSSCSGSFSKIFRMSPHSSEGDSDSWVSCLKTSASGCPENQQLCSYTHPQLPLPRDKHGNSCQKSSWTPSEHLHAAPVFLEGENPAEGRRPKEKPWAS